MPASTSTSTATETIPLAEQKLHDMTIEQQKDLYGDEQVFNNYIVNLADRVRSSIGGGYSLPKEKIEPVKANVETFPTL
ncbi:uncharacterized protein NDAI_0D04760 [Naumovozyma dairenensis CBS 421]|uniref:Uncharacterized protein n=1 Tax=Naumovozyma dairenensis (strain ATCC 10597 / BCRC 20456 / CBS 421 / NBRC 0211 / NRRL Y-12639) TaxID=1071378 RepID=G0WAH8_NAUDC|nr:hypothetical protein NDAI_0D04760 [Naumovozyma dairenensis CBS 421]CCD24789.1 hypothetical protein NDAI_0D04760 [Naumovozyma dairenensis CBS 421]